MHSVFVQYSLHVYMCLCILALLKLCCVCIFSCVKGMVPKVGDRVFVEASYNPAMPFKWNATRVQVLSNTQVRGCVCVCAQLILGEQFSAYWKVAA